jgi:uncharacterized protein YjbJ (UPF0337 family)
MGEHIDETKGRVKIAVGELTGNEKLKNEGRVDKVSGKIKKTIDQVADKAKKAAR